jgi:transcriptional regulator with PAS, ATPase and Fis domain
MDSDNEASSMNEREILYKVLFDMKGDLNDLKQLVLSMIKNGGLKGGREEAELVQRVFNQDMAQRTETQTSGLPALPEYTGHIGNEEEAQHAPMEHAILSLQDSERELIRRALEKHRNKRKHAAEELGISERTLYRKIKEYDLK